MSFKSAALLFLFSSLPTVKFFAAPLEVNSHAFSNLSTGSTIAFAGVILENPFASPIQQCFLPTTEAGADQCAAKVSEFRIRIAKSDQIETIKIGKAKELELLKRLKIGDFLSFQGVRDPSRFIELKNIDFVGLRDLVGTWTGEDGKCYHFKNFTRLIISKRILNATCPDLIKSGFSLTARDFRYFITPSLGSWDVLISDNQEFFSADFSFQNPNTIQMRIFDSNTGIKTAEFLLRK